MSQVDPEIAEALIFEARSYEGCMRKFILDRAHMLTWYRGPGPTLGPVACCGMLVTGKHKPDSIVAEVREDSLIVTTNYKNKGRVRIVTDSGDVSLHPALLKLARREAAWTHIEQEVGRFNAAGGNLDDITRFVSDLKEGKWNID